MNRFNMQTRLFAQTAAASALVLASQAHAAAVDVADVVTDIEAQAAPVALVGIAILVLFVGIKAFKWVRKALS